MAIIGLWAAAVYEPTAIISLARKAGESLPSAVKRASFGTGLLSIARFWDASRCPDSGTGRKRTLAIYFAGMGACILVCFGGRST